MRRVELYLASPPTQKARGEAGANTLVAVCVLGRWTSWAAVVFSDCCLLTSDFQGPTVMGSSDKVHVMDALAITGDEGRGNLRKAPGSW